LGEIFIQKMAGKASKPEGFAQRDQDGGQDGGQVGGQDGGQVSNLSARQKEVFELIVANPNISRKEPAERLGINESAIQKHTDALKKKEVIEREGQTTGHWIIIGKR